eukprot:1214452-Prymnesium_polylepis.1
MHRQPSRPAFGNGTDRIQYDPPALGCKLGAISELPHPTEPADCRENVAHWSVPKHRGDVLKGALEPLSLGVRLR